MRKVSNGVLSGCDNCGYTGNLRSSQIVVVLQFASLVQDVSCEAEAKAERRESNRILR